VVTRQGVVLWECGAAAFEIGEGQGVVTDDQLHARRDCRVGSLFVSARDTPAASVKVAVFDPDDSGQTWQWPRGTP
jgi:hypothetical protein